MDTTQIITLTDSLRTYALSYNESSEQKDAINGQTSGSLTVNGKTVDVRGTEFNALIVAEVTELDSVLTSITTNMQNIVDSLDALI